MTTPIPRPLRVHGLDLSYFTGKLEGYLRNKGIAYELVEMDTADFKACGEAVGVAQMPQVEWHDGQWLSDTTRIIDFLEQCCPDSSVLPDDPETRFVAQLIEDFGDEWLWRPALYYRWAKDEDARLMGTRLARGMMRDVPLPLFLRRWAITRRQQLHFLWLDGYSPRTAARTEGMYLETLQALEQALSGRRFVLGDAPTVADYGLFGSMFRHFFCDPTPARLMRQHAPAVHAWVARLWDTRLAPGPCPVNRIDHAALAPLLRLISDEFLPCQAANEQAWLRRFPLFRYVSQGVTYRLPTQPYRAWRFQRLRRRAQALPDAVRAGLAARHPALMAALAAPVRREVPDLLGELPIRSQTSGKARARTW